LSWYWARFFPKISSKLIRFSFRVCYSGDCLCDSRELQRFKRNQNVFGIWKDFCGSSFSYLVLFSLPWSPVNPFPAASVSVQIVTAGVSQQFFSPLVDSVRLAVKKLFCKRFAGCFRVSKSRRSFV
jgi:hypothetical protein